MTEENEPKGNALVPKEVAVKHNLTERQTKIVGLITLWIILAGLWKTVETVWVMLSWLFR